MNIHAINLKKYPRAWWFGIAALVVTTCILGLYQGWIYAIDWPITYAICSLRTTWITENIMEPISSTYWTVVLLFSAFIMCALMRKKYLIWLLLINVFCAKYLSRLAKLIFDRPRPYVQDPSIFLMRQYETSFPSGHAMVVVAFFGLIIYLLWAYNKDFKYQKQTRLWCVLIGALVVLVLISRIYLAAHFASDVIAGSAFSIIWLCFYTKWIVPFFIGKPEKSASSRRRKS